MKIQNLLVSIVRRSWRIRRFSSFDVTLPGTATHAEKITVPIRRGVGLVNLESEKKNPWAIPLFTQIWSNAEGAFLDVGANVGQMLIATLKAGKRVPYLAVEPLPFCAAYLGELMNMNLVEGACFNCALADYNGWADLMLGDEADVSATIKAGGFRPCRAYRNAIKVPVNRGDDVLAGYEKPVRMVKIDAEGAESSVLKGLEKTVERWKPVLILEVLPYAQILHGNYSRKYFGGELNYDEQKEIIAVRRHEIARLAHFITTHGYLAFRLEDGHYRTVEHMDPGPNYLFKNRDIVCVSRDDPFIDRIVRLNSE